MPHISVIIPVYNAGNYIVDTLNSVLQQTLKDIEVIVVNDGSNDQSLAECYRLQEIDKRIIIINQDNQGVSKARNVGKQNATGDYIIFIDADDELDCRMLYFIYIAFTIYMFLDSSAINFVCNLFPDAASTILNQYHNAGIPGLTKHYSTNGMLLAVGTMIFGSYALTEKRRSDYLLFLISVAALLLSGKRAHTVFGLTALYLCYFAYNSNAKKSRLVKCIGVLLGALTVFAVASYCVPALATVVFRFIDTAETGDMSVGRVDVWLKAFSMFGKHSLVGIGWGQYVNQGGWFWNIHNIYIQLLVETGIIGFIIYCGWFLFHLVRTWSTYSKMRVNSQDYMNKDYCLMNFSLAMQIFFLLYGFTGNPLYDREMFVPYFIACAISVNYANNDDGSELE